MDTTAPTAANPLYLEMEFQKAIMHHHILKHCVPHLKFDTTRSSLAKDQQVFVSNCVTRMSTGFQVFYSAFSQTMAEIQGKAPGKDFGKEERVSNFGQ
jgi:hypothetical protein